MGSSTSEDSNENILKNKKLLDNEEIKDLQDTMFAKKYSTSNVPSLERIDSPNSKDITKESGDDNNNDSSSKDIIPPKDKNNQTSNDIIPEQVSSNNKDVEHSSFDIINLDDSSINDESELNLEINSYKTPTLTHENSSGQNKSIDDDDIEPQNNFIKSLNSLEEHLKRLNDNSKCKLHVNLSKEVIKLKNSFTHNLGSDITEKLKETLVKNINLFETNCIDHLKQADKLSNHHKLFQIIKNVAVTGTVLVGSFALGATLGGAIGGLLGLWAGPTAIVSSFVAGLTGGSLAASKGVALILAGGTLGATIGIGAKSLVGLSCSFFKSPAKQKLIDVKKEIRQKIDETTINLKNEVNQLKLSS